MKKYVFDASFLISALIDKDTKGLLRYSEYVKEATEGEVSIFAPPLLRAEFANFFTGRKNILELDKVSVEAFAIFKSLPITYQEADFSQLWQQIETARALKQTLYDHSYHFLAILIGGTFLTCDKRYFEAASKLGSIELV